MDLTYLIAQGFGIFATLCCFAMPLFKKKWQMLLINVGGNLFFILNLLLPGCQHTASADHSLRTAARAGNLQAIQQAIEQGETVNPPPGLNQTPLGHLLHQYKRSNTTQQLEIEQAGQHCPDFPSHRTRW